MNYLDTFAGIGTAELAFGFHGWQCLAHAETDKFASAVLAHRFPDVPNLGDVTGYRDWPDYGTIDLVCGGTPCQAFSLAGLRRGLADSRGNLMLSFLGVVGRYRPSWVVWENVTGVLSQDKGRAFATFLGGLEDLGYGFAWRVLDAQYFRTQRFPRAVPQRRRRVFVLGYLGSWRRAAEILFEPESLRRDNPPSRAPRQNDTAGTLEGAASRRIIETVEVSPPILSATNATGGTRPPGTYGETEAALIAARLVSFGEYELDGVASPVLERDHKYASDLVASSPSFFNGQQDPIFGDVAGALGVNRSGQETCALDGYSVRRLTPRECERLQGLPDDWTLVPFRKKPATDAARYRVIGNAWPLNSADWIAERITENVRLNA